MTRIAEVGMSELLTSGIVELGITRIEKKRVLEELVIEEPSQEVAICYTGPFTLSLGIDCLVVFRGLAVGISFRGILDEVNCELDPALFYQGIRYQLCPDEHQIYYCLWLSSFSKKAIIDAKMELCKEDVKEHQLWLLKEKISGKAVEGNGAKVWRDYLKQLLKERLVNELTMLTRNKKNAIETGRIMELEMAAVHLMKVPFKFIIKNFQPQNEKRLLFDGAVEQAEPKRKKRVSSDLEVEVAITNEKPVRSFVPRTGRVSRGRVNFPNGF